MREVRLDGYFKAMIHLHLKSGEVIELEIDYDFATYFSTGAISYSVDPREWCVDREDADGNCSVITNQCEKIVFDEGEFVWKK